MRAVIVAAVVCLAMLEPGFAQVPPAATTRIETRIAPQPLSSALKEFAKLRHVQVLFLAADVDGVRTAGASGNLTASEALAGLLSGTGLNYRYVDRNAVSIIAGSSQVGIAGHAKVRGGPSREVDVTHAKESARDPKKQDPPDSPASRNGAANAPQKSAALMEIVVTAQKYRQEAFDVPISLAVLTATELQAHGITNLSSLQQDVPGLYMMDTGTNHAVYLRGVGNYFGNGALVGQYIDDADLTDATAQGAAGYATGDAQLYDLERVEVLRGPQGTLYGDGAMGGVIRYITKKPRLSYFQMGADVAAMFTQYGAPSQRIQAMLNTPLVSGTLGLRLAGQFEHDGGWIDEPAANVKNINGGDLTDVRAQGLWKPSEDFSILAMEIVHRHASGINAGEDAHGNFTPLFDTTLEQTQEDDSDVSNITMTLDTSAVQLLSSSTYFKEEQGINNQMTTYSTSALTFWYLYPHFNTANEGSSEELRISNTGGGRWHWTMGGFYKHFLARTSALGYFGVPGPLPKSEGIDYDYGDSSSSYAAFADSSWRVLGSLTLGGGVRYFKDRETTYGVGMPFQAAHFASTDPRFYIQYRATPDLNVYASASKGFRSGGFNARGIPPYSPETLWSYDLGTKMRFPRYGAAGNIDVFYSNYAKYDIEGLFPPNYEIENAGSARIEGLDVDLTWQPMDAWRFSLNTEVLDTKLQNLGAAKSTGFAPGERLPFAPKYSFTAAVQRDFRWYSRPSFAEVYFYEISRVQYRTTVVPLLQSDVIRFLNFRTGIHWSESLTLELFAHNLLNDRGNLSPFGSFEEESARPRPRTLGVEFVVKF